LKRVPEARCAGGIGSGEEQPYLKWKSKSELKALVGKLIPKGSAVKQTLEGRRRRFGVALDSAMAQAGWAEVGLYVFRKAPLEAVGKERGH